MVSPIAAVPSVRKALVRLQRKFAAAGGVVLDGRDIGTVVLPNADVKVFLTASAAERARRRFAEISGDRPGVTLEEIEKNIILRDTMDSTRSEAPLKQADDAVLIDNTGMTLEETAEAIMNLCRKKSEARLSMRTLVYFMIRRIFEIVIFGIFRVKVKGRENIPAEGAVIVAPNHRSNWDPPLVGVAFNTRLVHYMAKEELFRNPVVSAVFTFLGSFPVKRNSADRAALRQALNLLGPPSGDGRWALNFSGVLPW